MNARSRPVSLCLLIALLVAAGVWCVMPFGPGVSRDGNSYMRYAQVLRGQVPLETETGVVVAVTHYPPGYPLMLAALNKVGLTLVSAARLVDAVCFGLTCGVAVLILLRHGRGTTRAVVAAVLLLVQPAMAFIHLWVVSEPPFLLLTAVLYLLLLEYVTRGGRGWPLAIGIGVCVAAGGLVRYVGLAYAPAACWLVWRSRGRPNALANAIWVAAAAAVPMAILGVLQRHVAGEVAHREVGFEALSGVHWNEALRSVGRWLSSSELFGRRPFWMATAAGWLAAALAAALATVMAVAGRRSPFGRVAIVLSATYVGLLLVSIMFIDHGTPLDDRLLAPVAMLLTLWFVADFPSPTAAGVPRWTRVAGASAAVVVVANCFVHSGWQAAQSYGKGLGFAHEVWRNSPLVAACRELPAGVLLYSNFPEPILLHTGREPFLLPGRWVFNQVPRPEDERDRSITLERLSRGGYVAFFDYPGNPRNPGKPMSIDQIVAAYPLRRVQRFADGMLLKSNKTAAKQRLATRAATQPD